MEKNNKNQLWGLPVVGGILSITEFPMFSSFMLLRLTEWDDFIRFTILPSLFIHIILGIIMIVLGLRIRSGKKSFDKEKKKLMILSWILVIYPVFIGVYVLIFYNLIFIITVYGFTGGLIVILGSYLYEFINKRNLRWEMIPNHGSETDRNELENKIEYNFCPECGHKLEGDQINNCPDCGNPIKTG